MADKAFLGWHWRPKDARVPRELRLFATRSVWLALVCCTTSAFAQEAPSKADDVLARVDNATIRRAAVERLVREKLPNLVGEKKAEAERAALETLVRQRLALAALTARKVAASDADVDHELGVFKEQLKRVGVTLQSHLKEKQLTEEELRFDIRWRLSWSAYLLEKLSDENLKKYFDSHVADFDGRKVHIAHLLLESPPRNKLERARQIEKAKELAGQIREGKLAFADAAKKHSQSPTAKDGGDIGSIERFKPMPESFSAAAFALKPGETSGPVETPFGVHLIHCKSIEPGKETWESQRAALRTAVTSYLFDTLVEQQRTNSKVEIPSQPASPRE